LGEGISGVGMHHRQVVLLQARHELVALGRKLDMEF